MAKKASTKNSGLGEETKRTASKQEGGGETVQDLGKSGETLSTTSEQESSRTIQGDSEDRETWRILEFILDCARCSVCHEGNPTWADSMPRDAKATIEILLKDAEQAVKDRALSETPYEQYITLTSEWTASVPKATRDLCRGIIRTIGKTAEAVRPSRSRKERLPDQAMEVIRLAVDRAVPSTTKLSTLGRILERSEGLPTELTRKIKIFTIDDMEDSINDPNRLTHQQQQNLLKECMRYIQAIDSPQDKKTLEKERLELRDKLERTLGWEKTEQPSTVIREGEMEEKRSSDRELTDEELWEEVRRVDEEITEAKKPALEIYRRFMALFVGRTFNDQQRQVVAESVSGLASDHKIRFLYAGEPVNLRLRPSNMKFQLRGLGGKRNLKYERWEFPPLDVEYMKGEKITKRD